MDQGQGVAIMVRVQPRLLAAIDRWRGQQLSPPTRAEVLRQLAGRVLEAELGEIISPSGTRGRRQITAEAQEALAGG